MGPAINLGWGLDHNNYWASLTNSPTKPSHGELKLQRFVLKFLKQPSVLSY